MTQTTRRRGKESEARRLLVNADDAYEAVRQFYASGRGYHTLQSPDGRVLQGKWDMSRYLDYYRIPDDLTDKTVVDVGPANGYFSFELAKRNPAKIVALNRDSRWWIEELNVFMGANVEYRLQDLNTISDEHEKFDLVFCSHVLQHNSDLFSNMQRLRLLAKEMAIISTAVFQNNSKVPLAKFVGRRQARGNVSTFWRPNPACFREMAEVAGFNRVEEVSFFWMTSEAEQEFSGGHYLPSARGTIPSTVLHCYV